VAAIPEPVEALGIALLAAAELPVVGADGAATDAAVDAGGGDGEPGELGGGRGAGGRVPGRGLGAGAGLPGALAGLAVGSVLFATAAFRAYRAAP
jgi:hypothetical protein